MTVKVVALVTINENEPVALAKYLELTAPLLESVGAKIVQRLEMGDAVIGAEPTQSVIVVEYPDRAAVDAVFGSEAYHAAAPFRDIAFTNYSVTVVAN